MPHRVVVENLIENTNISRKYTNIWQNRKISRNFAENCWFRGKPSIWRSASWLPNMLVLVILLDEIRDSVTETCLILMTVHSSTVTQSRISDSNGYY